MRLSASYPYFQEAWQRQTFPIKGIPWQRFWIFLMQIIPLQLSQMLQLCRSLRRKLMTQIVTAGFVYQMEPYAGSHTRLVETGLGQGPSVVLGLAEKAGVPPGCKFYYDNLFTTLTLVDEMTKRGYGSCGTLWENRLFDIPLTSAKSFRKTSRGDAEFLVEDGKLIMRWNDNSVVTVVTNMEQYSDVNTQQWNKQKHAMDKVKQPTCIKSYNAHIGGVDLHDQCVNRLASDQRSSGGHATAGQSAVLWSMPGVITGHVKREIEISSPSKGWLPRVSSSAMG
ncbi:piggyBac transposable element-derived protein 3-like [Myxocyprinus asiaticus]|uniref:piggyBac transposable element-derived protein 3-like n=1 Tax=Myxocyprinus asiaticus TaxID=70543 RepID=UPI002222622A|nr:piggyBac transposable element-derived protein 3-like [Myxocyprinus asiaticus]